MLCRALFFLMFCKCIVADLLSGRSNDPGATASPAGRRLQQTANPVQTTAGDVQTLEDEANADVADTLVDDAFGEPFAASCDQCCAVGVVTASFHQPGSLFSNASSMLLAVLLCCCRQDSCSVHCLCIELFAELLAVEDMASHCPGMVSHPSKKRLDLNPASVCCLLLQFHSAGSDWLSAGLQMHWMATAMVQMAQASLMAKLPPQAPTQGLSTHPRAATAESCTSCLASLELSQPQ